MKQLNASNYRPSMLADSGEVSEVMLLDLQRSKNNQECEYRELEFDLWREEMLKSKEALQIRERELEANVRMADDQVKNRSRNQERQHFGKNNNPLRKEEASR